MWTVVALFSVLDYKCYYNVIFSCKEAVTDFDYIVCVKIVCLFNFIEVGFLKDAFVFTLALAIILFIRFLKTFCKWRIGINDLDFHIVIYIFRKEFAALVLSIVICFCWVLILVGYWYCTGFLSVPSFSYAIYDEIVVPWSRFSPKS